jgi:GT2 family glycosyltransferase
MDSRGKNKNMLDNFVSVIIVNYNGKSFLKECLDTISNQSVNNYEIILVDNCSIDGSAQFVKINYPKVKVIELQKNNGFAKGNNIGIENAKGRYAILLNNDTKTAYNFVEALYKTITAQPNYGLAGACEDTWDLNLLFKNGYSVLGYGLTNVFRNPSKPSHAAGFAFIFDRAKIPKPFDEDYFMFYEDNYISWLNKLKGYDISYTSKPIVLHYGSGTSGKRSRLKVFFGERNRIMNLILFYSSSTLVKLLPMIILNMVVAPLRSVLVYRRETYVGEYLKGYLWILRHFGNVMEKRRKIQVQRRVSDEEILKHFTYKITDGRYNNVLNSIAKIYCITVRIKTFDL